MFGEKVMGFGRSFRNMLFSGNNEQLTMLLVQHAETAVRAVGGVHISTVINLNLQQVIVAEREADTSQHEFDRLLRSIAIVRFDLDQMVVVSNLIDNVADQARHIAEHIDQNREYISIDLSTKEMLSKNLEAMQMLLRLCRVLHGSEKLSFLEVAELKVNIKGIEKECDELRRGSIKNLKETPVPKKYENPERVFWYLSANKELIEMVEHVSDIINRAANVLHNLIGAK